MRKWLLQLLQAGEPDYVLMRSLIDRNESLERRHKKVMETMMLIDGLLSSDELEMAQAQLRGAIVAHRVMR